MSEPAKPPNSEKVKTRSSRRLAWIVGAIALAVVGWSLLAPRLPGTPFTLKRNADGQLVPVATNGVGSLPTASTSLHAATIRANNATSASHRNIRSANYVFACRRVAIMNHSDHPLLQQIGQALPDQLSKLAFIEEVDYYPANSLPPAGQRSPDLWITLDLGHLKTFGMLPRFNVKARVNATAGSTLAQGRYSRSDSTSPPIVENYWHGVINHESTTTGVSTDKFSLVAENISAELAKHLIEHLQVLHDKNGPLPKLNAACYPAYTPTPPLINFDDWDARQIASSHGFMFSNETFWRVTTTNSVVEMLKATQDRLEQNGWKTRHLNDDEDQAHLSMTLDDDCLDIFVDRHDMPTSHVTIRVGDAKEEPASEPRTVFMHYVDRLGRAEMWDAIDRQFEAGGPLESLLLWSGRLSGDQRIRLLKHLEEQNPSSAKAWFTVANEYHKSNQADKARQALRRAHWLARFDPVNEGLPDEAKKLTKELQAEPLLKEPPSADLFRELGFVELKPDESTEPIVVGPDEPVFYFAIDKSGDWHVLNWRVKPDGRDASGARHKLAQAHISAGVSSWGSGNFLPGNREVSLESQQPPGLGKVTVEIARQAEETFRFVAKLEP